MALTWVRNYYMRGGPDQAGLLMLGPLKTAATCGLTHPVRIVLLVVDSL